MKQLLEKKQGARVIVFALLLTMLAWLAPMDWQVAKAAEGDVEIPVTGGSLLFDKATGTITGYKEDITEVNIPETYDGTKVTHIGEMAFLYCGLTNVTIPNSVTSIGSNAFSSCGSLTSVTIPNSVTSIGEYAFSACVSLTSINIPDSVTSIGEKAFGSCLALSTITVDDNNQKYSDQQGVLFDKGKNKLCQYPAGRKASSYEIPNSVAEIAEYAFRDCSSLASVNIPGSVDSIGEGVFYTCSGLTSVTIPNSVASIGEMAFAGCSSLASITIPSSVTTIGEGAFLGCEDLTSVTIPNSMASIGDSAFSGCASLASVTIPDSVISIGNWAFGDCASLISVNIPNSVTSIGEEAFGYYWNDDLYTVKVPNFKIYGHSNDSAAAKYARENGFAYAIVSSNSKPNTSTQAKPGTTVKDKKSNGSYVVTQTKQNGGTATYKKPLDKKKTSVTIPATIKVSGKPYKVTVIGKNAFKGNKNLKSVKIGANVEKIEANAFNKCTKLKKVKIPKKVKTIQKMAFADCKNLKSITIQTKKLTKKTVGTKAFKGVNKKATVKVPKGKAKAYAKLLRSKGLSKGAKVK